VRVELGAAQDQLTEWSRELDAARQDLDGSRDLLSERAAAAYRLGPVGHLQVVLGADNLTELGQRVSYLEAVLSIDAEDVRDVSFARGVVAERQDQVETYESAVAERESEVEERTLEIAQMEAEQAALLEQVDLEIDLQLDTLDTLQEARERYEDAVAQLQAQSAQIQGLIQGTGSTGAGQYGGELFWPTSGPIVSGFGYRVHPVYGTTRFHSGVDIDGACGQPIFAGEDGTVLSAGSNGGYGNFTVVDHGDGLATAYAHQSSVGVSSGQSVSRGQQIGLVGTTGLSTGCHLHFEVRVNGEPVDPVPYLT
jgi:murein DD-endopeptidase MepM/ murein hydrolase activator NlpD